MSRQVSGRAGRGRGPDRRPTRSRPRRRGGQLQLERAETSARRLRIKRGGTHYAAERFNVPKLEALDWLKQANLRCGLHWWVAAPAAAKRPAASPQTAAGKVAAATMAPTLVDLDRKVLRSKLAACLLPVATPRNNQLAALAATLAVGGSFRGVDAVFVDPDTGISRSKSPAYIHFDEITPLAAERHVLIYQHQQRKTIPQLAAHVRAPRSRRRRPCGPSSVGPVRARKR